MYSAIKKLGDWMMPAPAPLFPDLVRAATSAMVREAEKDRTIRTLSNAVMEMRALEALRIRNESEHDSEIEEAMAMAGRGPWRLPGAASKEKPLPIHESAAIALREQSPLFSTQGAYGDIELALQNIEWKKEINTSWLEFSRWGIQQIILISRLYYIKNPLIRRGTDISADYVFGRGVQVTATDPAAREVIDEFFARNKKTLSQSALTDLERRKYYDGNIFHVLFADKSNTGLVSHRTIDATEISEIVTDPDDVDYPQYYKREWIDRVFDTKTGEYARKPRKAWYPALNYEPPVQPKDIAGVPVMWGSPVLHRKCGAVAKWSFGCPLAYAALDWAKADRRYLENAMTLFDAIAQFALVLTSKGGQQALEGAKAQLATTVGPAQSLWDQNPTAVPGAIFASGPGTTLEAFKTKGAGLDPADVREYKLMVAMVFGIPVSWLADIEGSNLWNANNLDRPTELSFQGKQEPWREDIATIAEYVLKVSYGAPSGKLREAAGGKKLRIFEARRVKNGRGQMIYEAAPAKDDEIKVMVTFPAIIEADIPAQVTAVVEAMTLGNSNGNVVGIDEKDGVRLLDGLLDVPDSEERLEEQYPSTGPDAYDPLRTQEPTNEPEPNNAGNPGANQPGNLPRNQEGAARPKLVQEGNAPVSVRGRSRLRGSAGAVPGAESDPGSLREGVRRVRRVTGSADLPLSDDGKKQVEELAKKATQRFSAVFAPPNKRGRDTAVLFGPYTVANSLDGWPRGEYEGRNVDDVKDELSDLVANPDKIPPGTSPISGEPGKSWNQMAKPLFADVMRTRYGVKSEDRILFVTSGGNLQAVDAWARAGHPVDGEFDKSDLAKHPYWSVTGRMFRLTADGLVEVSDNEKPGVYFAEHGQTKFNTNGD
jgi:broad specificity phosphatase PhoE